MTSPQPDVSTPRRRGAAAPIVYFTRKSDLSHHEHWLETFGFRVAGPSDGRETDAAFNALAPRLLVASVTADDPDDLAFIRQLRADPKAAQPILVVITDGSMGAEAFEGLGIDAVLVEPLDSRALRQALRSVLALPYA